MPSNEFKPLSPVKSRFYYACCSTTPLIREYESNKYHGDLWEQRREINEINEVLRVHFIDFIYFAIAPPPTNEAPAVCTRLKSQGS